VRLGATEETTENHFRFQISHNSVMASIHSHEANIFGETEGYIPC